ncbi:hypothetical protein K438DRAFT_1960310 [Mycena galopus ATCC 62051]|nr:hypothetical protein K438DRAFT_1960310 [Mycena galopus ATCC 62051]
MSQHTDTMVTMSRTILQKLDSLSTQLSTVLSAVETPSPSALPTPSSTISSPSTPTSVRNMSTRSSHTSSKRSICTIWISAVTPNPPLYSTSMWPLYTYFAILGLTVCARLPDERHHSAPFPSVLLTVYFNSYLAHLTVLAEEYGWRAVVVYHARFFDRQVEEMRVSELDGRGTGRDNEAYVQWGEPDMELLKECVFGYPQGKGQGKVNGAKGSRV